MFGTDRSTDQLLGCCRGCASLVGVGALFLFFFPFLCLLLEAGVLLLVVVFFFPAPS